MLSWIELYLKIAFNPKDFQSQIELFAEHNNLIQNEIFYKNSFVFIMRQFV